MKRPIYNSTISKYEYSSPGRTLLFLSVLFLLSLINTFSAQILSDGHSVYSVDGAIIYESPSADETSLSTEEDNIYKSRIYITDGAFMYSDDEVVTNALHNKEEAAKQLRSERTTALASGRGDKKEITHPQHPQQQAFFVPCSRTFYALSSEHSASAVISSHFHKALYAVFIKVGFQVLGFSNTVDQMYAAPEQVSEKITNGGGIRPPPLVSYI